MACSKLVETIRNQVSFSLLRFVLTTCIAPRRPREVAKHSTSRTLTHSGLRLEARSACLHAQRSLCTVQNQWQTAIASCVAASEDAKREASKRKRSRSRSCSSKRTKDWIIPLQIFGSVAELRSPFIPAGASRAKSA